MENTQVDCWRIHSFSYRKSLKEIENTQFFGWSIHKLIVREHTVVFIGTPLRKSRIHNFWVENTQVDCWRIHSFSYRKFLKELENTQFLGLRIHELIVGEYTVFPIGKTVRDLVSFWQCGQTPRLYTLMLWGLYTVISPPSGDHYTL